jgi:hypothetical protein
LRKPGRPRSRMHGSAWRGNGAEMLMALAQALEASGVWRLKIDGRSVSECWCDVQ